MLACNAITSVIEQLCWKWVCFLGCDGI